MLIARAFHSAHCQWVAAQPTVALRPSVTGMLNAICIFRPCHVAVWYDCFVNIIIGVILKLFRSHGK
jgi:hypothetical protein